MPHARRDRTCRRHRASRPYRQTIVAPRRCAAGWTAVAAALLGACDRTGSEDYQGYIEGEYVYLAAPAAGYLATLDTERGSRVATGAVVFSVAGDPDRQGLAEAEARAAAAEERASNLAQPQRFPEIAAAEARLRATETAATLAETRLRQQQALAAQGFVSAAGIDDARAARARTRAEADAARAELAEARAQIGRGHELRGAQAEAAAARAQAAQKRWQVDSKTVTAPAAGEIAETYYRPGEWVQAGQPVASLLPDDRRLIRFFVPETAIAALRPGQAVEASCDGCRAPIRAHIAFIAPRAEYTPPVIYGPGTREKLVFRVEATAAPDQAPGLRPGLPVDVRLVGG